MKKTEPTFHFPNADQCLTCKNVGPACEELNFKNMPRITVVQDFGIMVKCTNYLLDENYEAI